MGSHTLLTLKYPAGCTSCGAELARGTRAWWDSESRLATCLVCSVADPEDLFIVSRSTRRDVAVGSAVEQDRRTGRRASNAAGRRDAADAGRRLAAYLRHHQGDHFVVLDDQVNPNSRAGSDHVAVAASGVYVIDAVSHDGKPRRKVRGCWPWRSEHLIVDGEDLTHLIRGMTRQTDLVGAALGRLDGFADAPVVPVVCIVGSDWDRDGRAIEVDGVLVVFPQPLQRMLRAEGALPRPRRETLARMLAAQLALPPVMSS